MQQKIARWMRALPYGEHNWWVRQHLFRVSPPIEYSVYATYRKGRLLKNDGFSDKGYRHRMKTMMARDFRAKPDPMYSYGRRTHATSFVLASASDLKSMMAQSNRRMRESSIAKKEYWEGMVDSDSDYAKAEIARAEETIRLFSEDKDNRFEVETYLFPCDKFGNWKDGGELPGSQRGTLDHRVPFRDIGYLVIGMPRELVLLGESVDAPASAEEAE